jgi:hypothetical protein
MVAEYKDIPGYYFLLGNENNYGLLMVLKQKIFR